MKKEVIRYLSLCGMLGYGYARESLENALKEELDFIGVDAGSTDPGPYYLGSGKPFVKRLQIKRDLSLILKHALERKIPFIIGSAEQNYTLRYPTTNPNVFHRTTNQFTTIRN